MTIYKLKWYISLSNVNQMQSAQEFQLASNYMYPRIIFLNSPISEHIKAVTY